MALPLPWPTVDHVTVKVRNQMDDTATQFGRLGLTLMARCYHILGWINDLAVFGT